MQGACVRHSCVCENAQASLESGAQPIVFFVTFPIHVCQFILHCVQSLLHLAVSLSRSNDRGSHDACKKSSMFLTFRNYSFRVRRLELVETPQIAFGAQARRRFGSLYFYG